MPGQDASEQHFSHNLTLNTMDIRPKIRIAGLLAGVACVLLSSCASVAQQPYDAYDGSISFETFYHELAPYGDWVHNPQYGQVWIPNVERDFRPYQSRGHWIMTEYGNTWVSDYAWGWAPFHYGRWYLDDYYGWMWVPGNEWGPAWVAWRSGGGYYGWAPLGPGLNVNVSINIGRHIPRPYWTFVQQRYITSPRIYDYCVPRPQVVNVINHTTIINNTYVYNNQHHYYSGPQGRDIEQVTHRPVPVRRVQNSRQPGATSVRGGSVAMYRPTVRGRQGNGRSVAPGASRSGRDITQQSNPTRSSYDPERSSHNPAVRSSRTPDNTARNSVPRQDANRSGAIRRGADPSGTTPSDRNRPMYDNRSDRTAEPGKYQQRAPQNRTPAAGQARPGTAVPRQDTQGRSRSSTYRRGERRDVPSSSPSRSRGSYGERPSSNSRRVPDRSSQRTRSDNNGSTFSQPASPRSSSPTVSSPSEFGRGQSGSESSAPSMRRPSETRTAPSETRSSASPSSSGSSRSSVQTGSSRSGGSRSRP